MPMLNRTQREKSNLAEELLPVDGKLILPCQLAIGVEEIFCERDSIFLLK